MKWILILFLFSSSVLADECCTQCKPAVPGSFLDDLIGWAKTIVPVPEEVPCPPLKTIEPVSPIVPEPEWPLELIKVEKTKYERNPKASFCKRPIEMVDTIVLHHSETPPTSTPEMINDFHLDRGTPDDPWYMIAYSYVINTPYPGSRAPTPVVTEGRPMDLVGAHAGSEIYVPMNDDQKKMWDEGKITCGREGQEFSRNPKLEKGGKILANVSTLGLVVIGNYSPFSRYNPNGYKGPARNPTPDTLDMVAKLSCQLQKKYPTIKNIKWHSQYHSTSCPGNLKNFVPKIRDIAKGYGCAFN